MPLKPKNKTVMWGLIGKKTGDIYWSCVIKPTKQKGGWYGAAVCLGDAYLFRLARVEVREIRKK
jgi:hypothetical protein